jgi:ABC-type branched-subunit amino acid transport system substrate-binding protein
VVNSHIGLEGNDFAFKTYLRKWILPAALRVSQPFRDAGGLSGLTGVAAFTPALDKPEVQEFVEAYKSHYELLPTHRSFFVFEATCLVVGAIRRAGSDQPAARWKAGFSRHRIVRAAGLACIRTAF